MSDAQLIYAYVQTLTSAGINVPFEVRTAAERLCGKEQIVSERESPPHFLEMRGIFKEAYARQNRPMKAR